MERLKELLKELIETDRSSLNSWFYNAKDADLQTGIALLNSDEVLQQYPRHQIREYVKFAKALLKGDLVAPPSDLDLSTLPNINYFHFAQGCYKLSEVLDSLLKLKYRKFIRICNLIIITEPGVKDSRGIVFRKFSRSIFQVTKPIASLCRLLNSRVTALIKIAFDSIETIGHSSEKPKKFRTKAQRKKIMNKCVREMIKKGRINLEQRAFWRWMIVVDENETAIVNLYEDVRDDFLLLKLLAHTANLRYFHVIKRKLDLWKDLTKATVYEAALPEVIKKKRNIKSQFKLKLRKNLVTLSTFVYSSLDTSFQVLKKYADSLTPSTSHGKSFKLLKPYLRNLVHILKKSLLQKLSVWKMPQYEYQYEEYEEVITTSTTKKSETFRIVTKPIVLYEFHTHEVAENKALYWNLRNLLKAKIRQYWNRWVRYKKKTDLNFSGEDTLDLAMFKLPFARSEKLRLIVSHILTTSDIRHNLPRVVLSTWMQQANKRFLTISKLKLIFKNQQTLREAKKHAFTAFQLASRFQTEFTDIA